MREHLQLLVRGTARTLVDPLRRDEEELVRRVNKAIQADVKDLEAGIPDERAWTHLFQFFLVEMRCSRWTTSIRSDSPPKLQRRRTVTGATSSARAPH